MSGTLREKDIAATNECTGVILPPIMVGVSATSSASPRATDRPSQERVPGDGPLGGAVWVNPARMHGEPCFRGTRVPVRALFDHLRAGDGLDAFLDGYDGVTREQAVAVIGPSAAGLLGRPVRS